MECWSDIKAVIWLASWPMVRRRTSARKKRTAYPALGAAPARRNGAWMMLVLGALVVVNLYVFVWDKNTGVAAVKHKADAHGSGATPLMALPSQPLAGDPAIAGSDEAAPVGPPGAIDGTVAKNDTLGRLLKKSGLSAAESDEVIRALSGVLDFKTIRPGQKFRIERGGDGRVQLFELELSKIEHVRAERQPTGELVGRSDQAHTKLETRAVGGAIDSSLWAAVLASGESPALVGFFVDVFAYDLDFYNDTHDGDRFRVVVEKHLKDDELVRYGRILAAEYRGKAGTFQTYLWNGKYYDAAGESSERAMLKTPLKFVRISSKFDRRRMHPVLHTVRAHLGIDYAAPTGTPVWAAAPGTITHRAMAGGAGNMVTIRHDNGLETVYMHLSKFANVRVGQHVPAKTVIGFVGTTGLSTGPHLHFGVKRNGQFIDPTTLAPTRGKSIPAADLEAFRAETARLDAMMANAADARVSTG
jgi:murein DD-endopeptidase MepM/ murein hydrolase activator NlpD